MFHLCDECYLKNVCERRVATVVSVETVRNPETRLRYQNHMVGLGMSGGQLIDFYINRVCDFPGRWVDENGEDTQAPGIACTLNPGAEFWFRDQIENGKWLTVDDVPKLRVEEIGRAHV